MLGEEVTDFDCVDREREESGREERCNNGGHVARKGRYLLGTALV
jgi:hypothetical protein